MIRHFRRIGLLVCIVSLVWIGGLLGDSSRLRNDILRLHVVGASDSEADQSVKLQVRDAILGSLENGLEELSSPEEAFRYVQQMIPEIKKTADRVLEQAGFEERTAVSVRQEAFPVREYDTFTLPSGVYQSLRVTIGQGKGHNWWCVVFPQLCMGATTEAFAETAKMSDMPDQLTAALTGDYEIRFWLLDKIGEFENFLYDTFE